MELQEREGEGMEWIARTTERVQNDSFLQESKQKSEFSSDFVYLPSQRVFESSSFLFTLFKNQEEPSNVPCLLSFNVKIESMN